MTEQAVVTKSLLHFTDIHRCIPLCSRRLPLRQKILKAWGLRRWASFAPLGPCGRLSRNLSRGPAFLQPLTTMPRLTPSRSSGFRAGCPFPTLHFPSHSLKVSRVHCLGRISRMRCGGVFFAVPLPRFAAPQSIHRVGQVYLCHLPHAVWTCTCRSYSRPSRGRFPLDWLTCQARSVRVDVTRRAIHA